MPRKRMIDPSIWTNEKYGELSERGRLVFIGMFSMADDEGRGYASPKVLKGKLFPYDEGLRIADMSKTLQEIGSKMSVDFYAQNGREYYAFRNWKRWQKVDKPTESVIPPPPDGGKGEIYPNDNNSLNTPRPFAERSPTIRRLIEKNRIEYNKNIERENACARGLSLSQKKFSTAFPNKVIDCEFDDSKYDIDLLIKSVKESDFFNNQANITLKSCLRHYEKLTAGGYKDFGVRCSTTPVTQKSIKELNALFKDVTPEEV